MILVCRLPPSFNLYSTVHRVQSVLDTWCAISGLHVLYLNVNVTVNF